MYVARRGARQGDGRLWLLKGFFVLFGVVIVMRLGVLQVVNAGFYQSLAEGQHSFYEELFAERGDIYMRDLKDGSVSAVATNELRAFVFADPRKIQDPKETARKIAGILGYEIIDEEAQDGVEVLPQEEVGGVERVAGLLNEVVNENESQATITNEGEGNEVMEVVVTDEGPSEYQLLLQRLSKKDDPYEPVARSVSEKTLQRILDLELDGIYYIYQSARAYPEDGVGGHVIGFLGRAEDDSAKGYYGIEGYFDEFLGGVDGFMNSKADASGRWIGVGGRQFQPAVDGGDIVLTIDRNIQYNVCRILSDAIARFQADGGSVVILEPDTFKVLAMCNVPDFDPDRYAQVEDGRVYQNVATLGAYEPGSVFKPIVVASALDSGAISPEMTFADTGEVRIGVDTIRNSDLKAHGIVTMTEILEQSLNTGMVYIMRLMGADVMKDYLYKFGFNKLTEIELQSEARGSLASLDEVSEIYPATASFGQGILVTPIQLAVAYNVLASEGVYRKPSIVEEKRSVDGLIEQWSLEDGVRIISEKTAATITAMMTSVIENGQANLASHERHYLAGKTGTAQVARTDGRGYDPNHTKATFAGYGPTDNPRFTVVVLIDRPRTSPWAASTAAPVFSEIVDYLVKYMNVSPTK